MEPISVTGLVSLLGRWSAQRGPLHVLLAARLRQLIEEGGLPPYTALPPDRTLAAALSVGRTTVVAAYRTLRQEGKLDRRQGSGTWVTSSLLTSSRAAAADSANPLFLHLLEPPDGAMQLTCASPWTPPPELEGLHADAVAKLSGITADMGYHPAGHAELRSALADRYSARGVPTRPDQILITTGAQQGLSLLVKLLVSPGSNVLVEAPTYPGLLELAREAGARTRTVRVGDDGLDLDAYVRAVADSPALAYAIPTFHNPTGALLPGLQRRRLVEACVQHGVPLIDDEALAELDLDGACPAPLAAYDTEHVISVGSLSKIVWGGLRVGWVRAAESIITRLARLKAIHDLGSALVDQWVAAALVPQLDSFRERRIVDLRARRDRLCTEITAHLPDWEFRPPPGGQALWVTLPYGDAGAFAQGALRHGVAVLPGQALDPDRQSGRCLRIPYLLPPDDLAIAVQRLATAWRAYDGTAVRSTSVNAMVV